MKKVRQDAIPPSGLHDSEARRRADDLKRGGARARACARARTQTPTWG